jgi:chitinase
MHMHKNNIRPYIIRLARCTAPELILCLGLSLLLSCCTSKQSTEPIEQAPDHPFKIIGYLPDYRINSVADSTGYFATDLIYFSIEPDPAGGLLTDRATAAAKTRLNLFRSAFKTRIQIAIGGWGRSDNFAPMAADTSIRKTFIQNLTQFCLANGFSGADYDWEFPQNTTEIQAYSDLLIETKSAFEPHGFTVSVAMNPNQYLVGEAYNAIDRIHIMAYDYSGRHSTYSQALVAVQGFLRRGIDSSKVCLGVPFYGRNISDFSQELSYAEIVEQYHPGPEVDEINNIYFNGMATIQRKTEYALSQHLGGIMIWEVGQDTHDDTSLLKTVYRTVFEQ